MNTKHNTKFSRKVIGSVVFVLSWLVIFPIVTFAGIINIMTNKDFPEKYDQHSSKSWGNKI